MTTDNPLLRITHPVPFDRIQAGHVVGAIDALMAEIPPRVEAIAKAEPLTWDSVMGALEDATSELERAIGVVGHLEGTTTTPELRAAYNEVRPKVSSLYSQIMLDEGLYRALRGYADTEEAASLPPIRARLLKKTLDDFKRHGAELAAEGKKRLAEITVEMSKITSSFAQNLVDATASWELIVEDESRMAGMPPSALAAARADAEARGLKGYRLSLQVPSVIAVLTYLDDREIREKVWRAYNTRASEGEHDNRALIDRILQLRAERAELLGRDQFADLVLEDRMAKDAKTARAFLDEMRDRTRPHFEREAGELRAFRRELEGADAPELEAWDVGYYAEKERRARYDFDEEALRPYFAADKVIAGLFELAQRVYGIRIEPAHLPTWHPDVRSFLVQEEDGSTRAAFYVDPFPRDSKRGGAWMNGTFIGRREAGEPHVGLMCANITPPVDGKPALLTHREVETLFHEFGHLLHHVLTEVPERSLAGTNVAWDFVELPSQIMENWTWEREALDLFARHYETDEPLPEALFERMMRARNFRSASGQMRQIGLATLDMMLHTEYAPDRDGDPVAYAAKILGEHSSVPLPEGYAMLTGFQHLFGSAVGYAAGYYSYLWAEVLEADAFSRFRHEGIFNRETGKAFREQVLSKGDSEDPADLFEAFMGRGPTPDALFERKGLSRAP